MNTCLFTKLKSSPDRQLPIYGSFNVFNSLDTYNSIALGYGGVSVNLITESGYFTDSTGTENLGTTFTIPQGETNRSVYVSEKGILVIPKKYELEYFYLKNPNGWDFDIREIVNMLKLKNLNLSQCQQTFDVGLVSELTDLEYLNLTYMPNAYGTLGTALAKLIKLKELIVYGGTPIGGAIEDIGDAMYSNGRHSGTLLINGGNFTYQGADVTGVKKLTFSSSGVTYPSK